MKPPTKTVLTTVILIVIDQPQWAGMAFSSDWPASTDPDTATWSAMSTATVKDQPDDRGRALKMMQNSGRWVKADEDWQQPCPQEVLNALPAGYETTDAGQVSSLWLEYNRGVY